MKISSILKIAVSMVFSCTSLTALAVWPTTSSTPKVKSLTKAPKLADPRDELYGKTANGDCGSGRDPQGVIVGYTGKGYKKDGFVIKFRSKLNVLGSNTWALLNGIGTDAYTIVSGKVDISITKDPQVGYVLTLDLKAPKSSATVAKLIKPQYNTQDFYSGLFFVRPELKQAFYQDLAKYTGQVGGTVVKDLFLNLFQQLGSTNTGIIENVDNSVFKDINSLGYVYLILSK